MTSLISPLPSNAFATAETGADYFATEVHYLSLAGRITAALRRGAKLVLIVGNPLPSSLILSQALGKVAAWWYAAIVIRCGPGLNHDQLLRAPLPPTVSERNGSATEAVEPSLSPLIIFDDVDKLSDGQLENIYEFLVRGELVSAATVFLMRPALLARLERFGSSTDRRTARLSFQELGREEIAPFISRQLSSGAEESVFTPEAITAIANVSGGDPGLVNCLARLMLEFANAAGCKGTNEPLSDADHEKALHSQAATRDIDNHPDAAVGDAPGKNHRLSRDERPPASNGPTDTRLRSAGPARRRRAGWPVRMAILVCLIGGFLAAPQESVSSLVLRAQQGIAAWIQPIRDETFVARQDPQPGDAVAPLIGGEHEKPTHAEAAPPASVTPEPPASKVGMPSALPATPENSATVIADRSTTDEPVPVRPTSNDGSNTVLTPAPAPAPTQPSSTAFAAATVPSAATSGLQATAPSARVASAQPQLSAAETAALVRRGDDLVGARDILSARLLYTRAAAAGDGLAALRLGVTFDPAFLSQANIHNAFGDQQQALFWYRRARDLGEAEAGRSLGDLKP